MDPLLVIFLLLQLLLEVSPQSFFFLIRFIQVLELLQLYFDLFRLVVYFFCVGCVSSWISVLELARFD